MTSHQHALEALSDPTRREILERLRHGPQPVGDLARGLSVSRPAVSQHLKVLAGAGLVSARAEGTRRIYRAEIRGLVALKHYLDQLWADVFEAFRDEADRGATPPSPQPPRPRPTTTSDRTRRRSPRART